MHPKEIAGKAVVKMNKKITNEIFLIIQNDRELMHDYLRAVHEFGLDYVNLEIGKAVKEKYSLINAEDREENPTCTLLQSHQKFQ